jgi:hypothetical protein
MSSFAILILILLLMPLCPSAQCNGCTGQSKDYIYRGGDSSPLTWYSLQRLEHPANTSGQAPIYCYERKVQNHSPSMVTDIFWPIAGYQRPNLPPGLPNCCCVAASIPGLLEQEPPQGPLHYGPGRTSRYNTTVYAPKGGWFKTSAQTEIIPNVSEHPPLLATIEVAIQTTPEKFSVSKVRLTSTIISQSRAITTYEYELQNQGEEALSVFWNIPQTYEFGEKFNMGGRRMSPESPLVLPPGQLISRNVTSREQPAWFYTTVMLFDKEQQLIARDITTAYGFKNGRFLLDLKSYWE